MKRKKNLLNFLSAALLACASVVATTIAAAPEASAQEPTRGTREKATRTGVVNFAELARQEALAPVAGAPEAPVAIHSPRPLPEDLPVSESLAVRETNTSRPLAPEDISGSFVPSPGPSESFRGSENLNPVPPDTHGAVGPAHIVVAINGRLRVMTRAGVVVSTVSLTQFWTRPGITINVSAFDPRVFYDTTSNRWIITSVSDSRAASSSVLVGVSQTSDPTFNWNLFQVDADPEDKVWADYPNLGFNKDWIVVQTNMFANPNVTPLPPFGSHIYVFNKADLMNGGSGAHTKFSRADIGATQVPAVTFDPVLPVLYLINNWSSSGGTIRLYSITGAVGSEVLNTNLPQPVASQNWSSAITADFAPQLDAARGVENNDQRMQSVVYRDGSLWCAQTIFLPAGGSPARSAVQWWEVNAATGAVLQRGRIDDPSGASFYAFPSIAVNRDRDVLVGYSRFSRNQYVSANYSFRAAADAPGTLREDVVFKAGEGPYERTNSGTVNRWGDYSATMVDPTNDTDFWTTQEYAAAPAGSGNGSGRWATWWARVSPAGGTAAPPITVRFPGAGPSVSETEGKVQITVARAGDLSAAALVDYSTSDGTATDRADYLASSGTLRFAPGEASKTITVFVLNDAYQESPKTFNLNLSNPRNCALDTPSTLNVTLTSEDAANGLNPMRTVTNGVPSFDPAYFVRQHYLDFLNREGDAAGVNFWTNQITSCGANEACIDLKKQIVSAEFFRSIEFQTTGYLVYRTYGAAFGTTRVGSTVPVTLREFLPDTQQIGRGVVVGQAGWEQLLEANRATYFSEFVLRPQFLAQYPKGMPAAAFVNALNANSGGALNTSERDALINDLTSNAKTRAQVLRAVAEDSDFNASEKDRAFVLMQYFGYMRRNPPDAPEETLDYRGYNFWLQKLINHNGDFVAAEMVRSFIISEEYKTRFGP